VTAGSSDAELLGAVAAEQAEALRLLHCRHAPWLRARLNRRCADRDVVDAAIQDTFIAVWRGADSFRPSTPDGDAAAWIWTIAIRRLVSTLRGPAHRWLAGADPDGVDDGPPAVSAEETVLLRVEHGDLAAALTALSPQLRAVIQATALDGLTTREAAVLLGIPEGTAKSRLRQAKTQLREHLA
jgi:RNA polymerase sigma-70 factor (ECF subfamily)